jgi:hypothetical protein
VYGTLMAGIPDFAQGGHEKITPKRRAHGKNHSLAFFNGAVVSALRLCE